MNVGSVCTREGIVVRETESLQTATQLMHDKGVGSVVVCEEAANRRVPIGLITDRDVAMAALRSGAGLAGISVKQAMSRNLLVVREEQDVADTLERMRTHAVRRAPVVTANGTLVGLVSIDDLLDVLVEQLNSIAHLIARQLKPVSQVPGGRTPPA